MILCVAFRTRSVLGPIHPLDRRRIETIENERKREKGPSLSHEVAAIMFPEE